MDSVLKKIENSHQIFFLKKRERGWLWYGNDEGKEINRTADLTAYSAPLNNVIIVNLLLVTLISKAECEAIFFSQDTVCVNDII